MIPDIELQLQVVIKSLKDNVVPAVDPENQLAQQQMHLSLATLDMALQHLTLGHQTVRKDIREHVNLSESILALCDAEDVAIQPLRQSHSDALAALQNPELGMTQLQVQARLLREALGQVIAAQADHHAVEKMEQLVLASSLSSLHLGRSWNKSMGFEPNPAMVKALDELL